MAKETGKGLYKKRYATLKEHRAAVAAQKTNKGGKNVGPVAHGKSYADSLKVKPAAKKPAPKPKASTPKPTAPKTTPRPKQTVNGASLGSKITAEERKKREEAMKPSAVKAAEPKKKQEVKKETPKPKRHRGGARSSNNTRGRTVQSRGPKAGDTRRTRKGSSYVTQMYDGKKWVSGKVGGKG